MRTNLHDTLMDLFVRSNASSSTMDSRLRGNDEPQSNVHIPSFPRRRESQEWKGVPTPKLHKSSFPRRRESMASSPPPSQEHGFTMIELTTVGLIIAVLVAIALPNYLEAQIRAKVTAANSDCNLLAQCLEEYYIANRVYPPNLVEKLPDGGLAGDGNPDLRGYSLTALTTPAVYLSTLPLDPFFIKNKPRKSYDYINFMDWMGGPISRETLGGKGSAAFLIASVGPDNKPITVCAQKPAVSLFYSPTNGTISLGDIIVLGP